MIFRSLNTFLVMGNELNKIEQNTTVVAQHQMIPPEAGQQLKEEVQVCKFLGFAL